MKKNAKLFVTAAIALTSIVLSSCAKKEKGITYTLLWNTKIEKVGNNLVVEKGKKGEPTTIYKKVNGEIRDDLKVLVFTDLHLDHNQDCCNYTFTMIAKNIKNVKPDLVVLCGDNITSIEQKPRARQFAKMMEDMDVYWSFVLGNHEGKEYPVKDMMSRPEHVKFFTQYSHCLIEPSIKHTDDGTEVWGNGNHAINILNSKKEVAQTFFFLDSGDKMSDEDWKTNYATEVQAFIDMGRADEDEVEFYDYIKDSQLKWYKETMAKYPSSNATIFSHVPLKDMEDAYLEYYYRYNHQSSEPIWEDDQGPYKNEVIWPYTEVTGAVKDCNVKIRIGHRAEGMCYGPHDIRDNPIYEPGPETSLTNHTAVFKTMVESGGKHPAFFCGHDHQNNFVIDEKVGDKTVTMGYIQPAGYSSNNFYTKGMLTEDPLSEPDKYHLIQGYSIMDLDLTNSSYPFSINHYTNYDVWNHEHYVEGLQLIRDILLNKTTPKDYAPAYNKYISDPNDPLKGINPPTQLA